MRVVDWFFDLCALSVIIGIGPIGRIGPIKKRLTVICLYLMIRCNTGKEVIQKFMSSNHSEVAAA